MKYLIVGAGLSGAVIARELAEQGHSITVIDKRDHIGGNCADYVNDHGIRVHRWGPHIFHTSNMKVVEWLSRFTEWVPYQHKVKALLSDGRYATLPVNRETKEMVGEENVLDIFFRPYTRKMWGKELEELDPSIMQRVPIRDDDNELYFPNDAFQAMPKDGYTVMFENILNHENIHVQLGIEFDKGMELEYDHVFNSMPIDVYFDTCYGELPYRSIRFHTTTEEFVKSLPTPTVNFTDDGPYTRVTEWKLYPNHGSNDRLSTFTREEPCDYRDNNMERYYPVKDLDGANREIYRRYRELVPDNVTFIGRCGQYVYIDMDMAVSNTLSLVSRF